VRLPRKGSETMRAGVTVHAADGQSVGHVTQVQLSQGTFLLERPGGEEHTLFVPFEAIDAVVLQVPEDQLTKARLEGHQCHGSGDLTPGPGPFPSHPSGWTRTPAWLPSGCFAAGGLHRFLLKSSLYITYIHNSYLISHSEMSISSQGLSEPPHLPKLHVRLLPGKLLDAACHGYIITVDEAP
jgi:hypothetical protein